MSPDEIPPTLPDLTSLDEFDPSACLPRQGPAPREHVPQQPPAAAQPSLTLAHATHAPSPRELVPPPPPSNFPRQPAAAELPVVVSLPAVAGPPAWPSPDFSRSPYPSVPVFRRTRPPRSWTPRFNAATPAATPRAYAFDACQPWLACLGRQVPLAPLQLLWAQLHHSLRQADRINWFRRFSAADPGGYSVRGIRGQGIRGETGRPLSYLRGRLNIAETTAGIV
jgi:hypothetical protein